MVTTAPQACWQWYWGGGGENDLPQDTRGNQDTYTGSVTVYEIKHTCPDNQDHWFDRTNDCQCTPITTTDSYDCASAWWLPAGRIYRHHHHDA